jgi:hypothetical protein
VGVRQLRLQVQGEGLVVVDLLSGELHAQLPALLVDGPAEHGVESGVDVGAEVLDDERLAIHDGGLDRLEPLFLRELDHDEVVLLLLPEPLDALGLRVDDERPALAVADDAAVLHADPVTRQALADHLGRALVVGDHVERVGAGCHGDLLLLQVRDPRGLPQLLPEIGVERAAVRHEAGGEHAVAGEGERGALEPLDLDAPALVLGSESSDKPLRQVLLLQQGLGLVLDLLLLPHSELVPAQSVC